MLGYSRRGTGADMFSEERRFYPSVTLHGRSVFGCPVWPDSVYLLRGTVWFVMCWAEQVAGR